MKAAGWGLALIATVAIDACGGGGGGGTGGGGSTVVPAATPAATASAMPTASPTAQPLGVSGNVTDATSGAALAGFTVTIGQVPVAATCLSGESNASMPCGVPAAPAVTATSGGGGAFALTVPAAGTYMLTIGKDATYATLHRTIAVTAAGLALGALGISALSADEQAWLIDVNAQRATVSVPASFSNLVVDEYAEEQARAEVAAIANGSQPYGDATEALFNGNYAALAGAMYGADGVSVLVGQASAYLQADAEWMAERQNCPNQNWQNCAFAENTGHYLNISSTGNVWIGLAESRSPFLYQTYGSQWAYSMIIIANSQATYPAQKARTLSLPARRSY